MTKTKSIQQQKRYLQIGFIFVFAASFAAILFERGQVSEETLGSQAKKPLPLAEYVKGEAIERGPGIQDYRDIVSENLSQLNRAIDALLLGNDASGYAVGQIYQNLLAAAVPGPYRSLHVALLALAKEAAKEDAADQEVLVVGRARLYEAYPWLFQITAKP